MSNFATNDAPDWAKYKAKENVDMDTKRITNLGDPSNAQDSVTKNYLDTHDGTALLKRDIQAYYSFDESKKFKDIVGVYSGTAKTLNSTNFISYDFADGTIPSDFNNVSNISINGGPAQHSHQSAIGEQSTSASLILAQIEPAVLSGGYQIHQFSFWYYETTESLGGGMLLLNSNGDPEIGMATENPEYDVYSSAGFERVKSPSSTDYQIWVKVTCTFDWANTQATIEFSPESSGLPYWSGTKTLAQGVDIARLDIRNNSDTTDNMISGAGGTEFYMSIDDIQVQLNPVIKLYNFQSGSIPSEFSNVSDISINGGPAQHSHQQAIGAQTGNASLVLAEIRPMELIGGDQIQEFSYWYYETTDSHGGGMLLFNSNGDPEIGMATENPEYATYSANGFELVKDPSTNNYDIWVKVTCTFDWSNKQATIDFSPASSGLPRWTGTKPLNKGVNIERLDIRDHNQVSNNETMLGGADGDFYMSIDDILVVPSVEGAFPQYSSTSIIDKSIRYRGLKDHYVDIGEGFNVGERDFTVSCWVNHNAGSSAIMTILNSEISGNQVALRIVNGDQAQLVTDAGGTRILTNSSSIVTSGTWHFITVQRETDSAGNSTGYIYINGSLDNSKSVTQNTKKTTTSTLGHKGGDNGDGYVDELAIWYRVLSESEIIYLYNEGNGRQSFVLTGWYDLPAQNDVNMRSNRIKNLGDPSASGDAINKNYLDSVAGVPPLKNDLRAYYTFDGDYKDSTGNYDGTNNGTTLVSGKIGQGAKFGVGESDTINVGKAFNFGTGDFTIALWFNSDSGATNTFAYLTSHNPNGTKRFFTEYRTDTGLLKFLTEDSNGQSVIASGSLPQDTWHFVAFTRAGSQGQIYANGQLIISGALQEGDITNSNVDGELSGSNIFEGLMDEVGAWNRVLTANEIEHLYNNGNGNQYLQTFDWYAVRHNQNIDMDSNRVLNLPTPLYQHEPTPKNYVDSVAGVPPLKNDLRAYYSFDGDYKDSTTNHYDGTPNGTTLNSNTSVIGSALEFTSGSDNVDIGKALCFDNSDFTISSWIYPKSAIDSRRMFLSIIPANDDARFTIEYGLNSNPKFRFFTQDTNGNKKDLITPTDFSTGQWYHVVITWTTDGIGQIWVNGHLDVEGNVEPNNIAHQTNISYFGVGDGANKSGDALLDEVGAWDRVLTQGEIEHLYNNGNGNQYLSTFDWYSVRHNQNIDMDSNRVLNLPTPLYQHEPTPKNYVDSVAGVPPLKNDLRVYYTFDSDYKDSTSNNYDGINNGATLASGKINQGASFPSSNAHINIGQALDFRSGDFTISFWFYVNSGTSSGSVLVKHSINSNDRIYVNHYSTTTKKIRFYTENNNNASSFETNNSYDLGSWHYLTLTRQGSEGKIYVNGQLDNTGTIKSGDISGGSDATISYDNSNSYLDGMVDEFGAWDRVLTADEIQHLYNNGNGTQYLSTLDWYAVRQSNHINMDNHRITNLGEPFYGSDAVDKAYVDSRAPMAQLFQGARAYYEFEGDATDSIGSYNGTLQNSPSFVSGKLGQAISFTTDNQNVDVGNAFHVQSGDLTVASWFQSQDNSGVQYILANLTTPFFTMQVDHTVNPTILKVRTDDGNNAFNLTYDWTPNENQWHYLVFTRTGGTGQFYIDGQLVKTGTVTNGTITTANDCEIGRDFTGGDYLMDEVGFWDRVLSENEIKYLYHNGQGTKDFVSYDYTFNFDIDMNSNQITNLADPTSAQDAVTRNYLEGGIMTNALHMNSNKITNVTDPTANQEVATKKYVDDNASSEASNWHTYTAGSNVDMGTYQITNVGDPSSAQDVASKRYVDSLTGEPLKNKLRAYYTFDGDFTDSTGNFDGTNNGASLVSGKIGQAMDTNSGEDEVSVGNLFNWGSSDFSVSCWVYPRDDTQERKAIFTNTALIDHATYLEYSTNTSGKFRFYTRDNGTLFDFETNNTYSPNQWLHVVITRTGSTGEIWVNGQLDKQGTVGSGDIGNTSGYIGDRLFFGYDGLIDEFAVWLRTLTKPEIEHLYNDGNGNQYLTAYNWYAITHSQNIDMDGNRIFNLSDPSNAQDAVTRNYLEGGTMTNNLHMNSNKITNVADPTSAQDVSTKNYVDTQNSFVPIQDKIQAYYSFDESKKFKDIVGVYSGTAKTLNSTNFISYDFADGTIPSDFNNVSDISINGGPAQHSHQNAIGAQTNSASLFLAQIEPAVLSGGYQIHQFSFWYFETTDSTGGGMLLLNSNGDPEIGMATENPQYDVYSGSVFPDFERVKSPSPDNYQIWVKVTCTFDWANSEATIEFSPESSGLPYWSGTKTLAQGVDIERLDIRNHSDTNDNMTIGAGGTPFHMSIDDIQIQLNPVIKLYDFQSGSIPSEFSNVSDISINGGPAQHSHQQAIGATTDSASLVLAEIRPMELIGGDQIQEFSFWYYETGNSEGGGMLLLNSNGDPEIGMATANPNYHVYSSAGFENVKDPPTTNYDIWVKVTCTFDWANKQATIEFSPASSGLPYWTGTKSLAKGVDIERLDIRNHHKINGSETMISGAGGRKFYMSIDDILVVPSVEGAFPQYSSTSIIDKSIRYRGLKEHYVDIGDAFNVGERDFTVSCWVNHNASSSEIMTILNSEISGNQVALRIVNGDQAQLVTDAGGTRILTNSSSIVTSGTWHFITVQRETDSAGNSTGYIYINGSLDKTNSVTQNTKKTTTSTLGHKGGDNADGYVDELAMWYRVLLESEIVYLYNGGNGRQSFALTGWYDLPAQNDVNMRSNRIKNLGDPSASGDAINKNYLDSVAGVPPLKNDLRAYWTFDGDYKDSTTNNYDGTPNGTTLNSNTSVIGSALEFTSDSDRVDIGNAHTFGTGDFSVSVWAYPNSAQNVRRRILTVGSSSTGRWILEYGSSGTQTFRFFTDDGSTNDVQTTETFTTGAWYHVVVTRTAGTGQIWVNGQLSKEGTVQSGDIGNTNNTSFIGDETGFNNSFDGLIDELASWDRVLTQDEIEHLYNNGNGNQYFQTFDWYSVRHNQNIDMDSNRVLNLPTPLYQHEPTPKNYVDSVAGVPPLKNDLRAYYSFDGDYKDSTTNHYDGTPNGTTLNSNTSVIGSALEFTSGSDNVNIGKALCFDNSDFTISSWIYPKSAIDSRRMFLSIIPANDDARFTIEYGINSNPKFRFFTQDTNGNKKDLITPTDFSTGQWYHVVITWTTDGIGQIWVNGHLDVEGNVEPNNIAHQTNISYFGVGGGVNKSGDALLDEIGAWNRVLTADEIEHLYNHGNGTQYLSTLDWYAVRQNNHINMNDYRITNLGEAFYGSDAVDKAYVDSRAPMAQLFQGARAYYEFEGDYTDSIGSFDGTNNGTTINSNNAVIGKSLEFTSNTDVVNIGNAFAFQTGDFSISVWAHPFSANDGRRFICFNSGSQGFAIQYGTNNDDEFRFFAEDANGGSNINTSNIYPPNRWYHIVITRTGSTGQIWVDGQKAKEGTIPNGDIAPTGNTYYLGDGLDKDDSFDGLIDEAGAWTRTLTENEIKYLYANGQGTKDFVSYDYTFNFDIDMNSNQITNLADPTSAQDAVTRNYLEGGIMTNALHMNSNKITNVTDPTANQEVATKKYVDDNASSEASNWHTYTAGSNVDMGSNRITNTSLPQNNSDVATKGYVDGKNNLSDGLITYFTFESSLTENKVGPDGTDLGGISLSTGNGIFGGNAMEASGTGLGVNNFVSAGSTFSLTLWSKSTNSSNQGDLITSAENFTEVNKEFTVAYEFVDTEMKIRVNMPDELSNPSVSFYSQTINHTSWNHIGFTYDDSTGNVRLYINGKLDNTGNFPGYGVGIFVIGHAMSYSAYMDECAIWDRLLSDKEMELVYNSGNEIDLAESNWSNSKALQNVDMNSNQIKNLGNPSASGDAINKQYLDSVAGVPPLKNDLRAYWSFDGDYKDSTNNHYDGTPSGTTLNSNTSVIGSALEFTSDADNVNVGDAFSVGTGDISISLWVYANSLSNTRDKIIELGGSTNRFEVSYGDNSSNFEWFLKDSGGSSIGTGDNFPANNWYHLVLTRTGSTGEIWVNGQRKVSDTVASGDIASHTGYFGSKDRALDGFIDELGAWNRVLTADEIQHLYNNGNGTQYLQTLDWYAVKQSNHINMDNHRITNLGEAFYGSDAVDKSYVDSRAPMAQLYQGARGYWNLNGNLNDSINSYDGTEKGTGNISFVGGKLGQGLSFTGTVGDYIELPASAFDFGTSDFTWTCWVNLVDTGDFQHILHATKGTTDNRIFLQLTPSDIRISVNENGTEKADPKTTEFSYGVWHFLSAVREGNTYRLYLDGQEKDSQSVSVGDLLGATSEIGSSVLAPYASKLDEVGAWNRALTENEIKYLYHNGQGTKDFVSYDYTFNFDIDMNSNQITNLADPTANQDAVTKGYTDNIRLLQDLHAFYTFESPNPYQDKIGNFDLASNSTTISSNGGIIGDAVDLGTTQSQHVENTEAMVDDATDFTVSVWYKPSALDLRIFAATGDLEWIEETDGVFNIRWSDGGEKQGTNTAVQTGQWQMLTVVWDDSAQTVDYYYNGSFDATLSFSSSNTWSGRFELGSQITNNNLMDEVGVWGRKLSASEIALLYNDGNALREFFNFDTSWYTKSARRDIDMRSNKITKLPEPTANQEAATKNYVDTGDSLLPKGIRAYYSFDNNLNPYNDMTGNYNGTNNGTTIVSGGKIGKGVELVNSLDYISIGNATNFGSGDFSISIWYNANNLDNSSSHHIVWNGKIFSDRHGILVNNEEVRFFTQQDSSSKSVDASISLNVGQWYFIVVTRQGSTGKVYIDGTLMKEGTVKSGDISSSTGEIGMSESNWAVNAVLDEIGIWDRVLTKAEVQQLYNGGNGTRYFINHNWYEISAENNVDMNSNKITNVQDPTSAQDVATKNYVDNKTVHTGMFVISAANFTSITGVGFTPSQVQFQIISNGGQNVNAKGSSGGTIDNCSASMTGFERSDGTLQAMGNSISGASTNRIRRFTNNSKSIFIVYCDEDGNDIGQLKGEVSSFDSDGFTIAINSFQQNEVVIYTAYA